MPLYEYKCTVCQDRFEIEQSIRDAALTTLPGGEHEHQLKKVFSPVGISFRGGGFYRNEARSASPRSDSSASSESSSSNGTSGSTTSGDKASSSSAKADAASTSSSTSTSSD